MRILYRAKTIPQEFGEMPRWIRSSLIQAYPFGILLGELDESIDITDASMSLNDLSQNIRWYPVFKDSLCCVTEYDTFNKDGGETVEPIFDKDLVEIELHSGTKYRYAVWYFEEGSSFQAIPWDDEEIKTNDAVFLQYPVNFKKNVTWEDFILMLENPFGDIKSVKIIGNFIDNPELFGKTDWLEGDNKGGYEF